MSSDLLKDMPPENYFYTRNNIIIKNLSELTTALEHMDNDTYSHHVNDERNDFCEWIKHVVQNKRLAKDVAKAKSKDKAVEIIKDKIEKTKKSEKSVKSVDKEIGVKRELPKIHEPAEIPLDKIDEIISREKEIQKREEKIVEIEERIEKQLKSLKKGKHSKFFTKEFAQGIVVGILLSVISILIYFKFFA